MQIPPEQMGPGGYPRPASYGQPEKFSGDLVVGIILIVLNAIGVCVGALAAGVGGMIAAGGTSMSNTIRDANGNTVSTQAVAGVALIFGIVAIAICVVAIIGAVGVIKSARWGLMTIFVFGIIGTIMSVVSFNPLGLVMGLFEAIYCGLRLFGNVGPRPI